MEIKEEEEERQWEQQTSLALRRSRFRSGHAPALEFGPSPVTTTTTDDDDDDAPQHIPPHFNNNGSANPNSKTNAHTDHMVARFDPQNIAASTDAHALARLHNVTHTHSKSHTSVYYDTAQGCSFFLFPLIFLCIKLMLTLLNILASASLLVVWLSLILFCFVCTLIKSCFLSLCAPAIDLPNFLGTLLFSALLYFS